VREIIGWLTAEVGAAMRNLIWKTKPDVCVEIGVFAGKSLINTALALKENGHGVVYGIDPWRLDVAMDNSSPQEFDWTKVDMDAVHYDCMRAIWQRDLDDFIVILRTTSYQAWKLFLKTADIDILYIDGGHSETSSSWDAAYYEPLVKHGGHIWLDDTNYDSLKKAISILENRCVLVKDFGHCRLYKKT
jgi:predicted O-methyltransferase YrrM